MNAFTRYEVKQSDALGRYLVAARDLKPGDKVLTDAPFALGPSNSSLVCFNCHLSLISKFLCCKQCGLAPVCPGDGCPENTKRWHTKDECDFFANLKLTKNLSTFVLVQNVESLIVLRVLLKKKSDPKAWEEFNKLETHLEERRNTDIWDYHQNTVNFIKALGLLDSEEDQEIVQKVCGAIDVNSFEVRGPSVEALGCAEVLRGVYLTAALLAHDCVPNTHVAITTDSQLVVHASKEIKKGEPIYYNYTDALKGTDLRQKHLMVGKYFKCECQRCTDPTELGTHLSSVKCPECKTGFMTSIADEWSCNNCQKKYDPEMVGYKIECCLNKWDYINKREEKDLEEFIKNVSLVLAPNHYVLVEAKQRLAGVLRDNINREPRPTKKLIRRKIELCKQLLEVLETLNPGISRDTAITLYELHVGTVQLAKKLFDSREINASAYMDELMTAEKILKRSLEMLFIEPGDSPEGELCAKALEEYRALKMTMSRTLDGMHADGKTYETSIKE